MSEVLAVVAGYLIGSIDFAVLVSRRMGVDIYSEGSGNPGASNVARVLGKKAGAAVMLGDLLKGVAAAGVGGVVGGSELLALIAGGAAVVGHCYPVFHGFRGGKGVATMVGTLLWTIPLLGLALGLIWIGVLVVGRIASFGSLAIVVLAVPGVWVWGEKTASTAVMAAISGLVIARHAGNIRRMFGSGEQPI